MRKINFLTLFLFFYSFTNAQADFNNTGTLHVSTGNDTLYVNGAFSNGHSSAFINNGNFFVKQNLSNSQVSMSTGTGTLYLNGSTLQSIEGTGIFKTFNFISNNTSGIVLNNTLSISGTHTFVNGVITTSATTNYLAYEPGSSYNGDADGRHVNGWVKKTGSTDFIFPVGNGTVERTIALNNLSASSEFNVKHNSVTPDTDQIDVILSAIDPYEYWEITKVTGGSATVTLNWDNSKISFPNWQIERIRATGYDGSNWMDIGGTASGNSSNGSVSSNNVSSFNKFTLGSQIIPLPLMLISFSAKYQGSYTLLNWKTDGEQNVDHFTVERSDDGIHFYSVSQVAARNSGHTEIYHTQDNKPVNRIAFFKLLSVDKDGRSKSSFIVTVRDADTHDNLVLLTNPVHNKVVLVAAGKTEGSFDCVLYTIGGELVQKNKLQIQNNGRYEIPVKRNLNPGTYILEVKNNLQSFHYRIIVQ